MNFMKLELNTKIRQKLGVSSEINTLNESRKSEVRRPKVCLTVH
jgi:hypothetical protein